MKRAIFYLATILLILFWLPLLGCGRGNSGQPIPEVLQFSLRPNSLTWDGSVYGFTLVDDYGESDRFYTDDVLIVEDSRNFADLTDDVPVVHLTEDEPITILAEDARGEFATHWFPFALATAVDSGSDAPVVNNQRYPGSSAMAPRAPAYIFPPTDSFGREDNLQGRITNSKPIPPDYSRVEARAYAVSRVSGETGSNPAPSSRTGGASGQAAGTGIGTAASGRSSAVSGQAGGTGSGGAATGKGSFAAGSSSFSSRAYGSGGSYSSSGTSSGAARGSSGSISGRGSSGVPSTGVSSGRSSSGVSSSRSTSSSSSSSSSRSSSGGGGKRK